MYNTNVLFDISKEIEAYSEIELSSEYKTDLFRSHLNGAISNLKKAGELAGTTVIPNNRNSSNSDQVVSILIIAGFILIMFSIL